MKSAAAASITLSGRKVDYRVVRSKTAKKLRVRVGPNGVEVLQPEGRESRDVNAFLQANGEWISGQLARVASLRGFRKPERHRSGEVLFRGEITPVHIECDPHRRAPNRVRFENGAFHILCGSKTPPARTLENWMRAQAREVIVEHLQVVNRRIKREPRKLFIMGQRTKWGNCSPQRNLSFNWRLILAPDFVLKYLVTHEAVHLAVPDHSAKFWLTVQSLCPETERAKQWLSRNGERLFNSFDLRMSKIGILAFGSLIQDPGDELRPLIQGRIKTETPFSVEFGRYSGETRGGAPTLVPHRRGGAVQAEILVLKDAVSIKAATDMLWRRETRQKNTTKGYPAGKKPGSVQVEPFKNLMGVETVLYTDFLDAGKIDEPTAEDLAKAAVASVAKADAGKDGITYLMNALTSKIETPLTQSYVAAILRETSTQSLEQALNVAKARASGA